MSEINLLDERLIDDLFALSRSEDREKSISAAVLLWHLYNTPLLDDSKEAPNDGIS